MRRVVLPTGLAGGGCVHLHEIFVGVTEQIVVVFPERTAKREVSDGVEQLHELLVALGDGRTELAAIDVEVVEEALDVIFGVRAYCGTLDVLKDAAKGLV